jgi:hypothetical protein
MHTVERKAAGSLYDLHVPGNRCYGSNPGLLVDETIYLILRQVILSYER